MKKGDLILYLVIGFIVVVSFMAVPSPFRDQELKAVIEVDGQYYDEVYLEADMEPRVIIIEDRSGRYNAIEISQGRIRMKRANCPDQVCVNMGWMNQQGHTIVCLPNRISIRLIGQEKSDVDIVP